MGRKLGMMYALSPRRRAAVATVAANAIAEAAEPTALTLPLRNNSV